MCQLSNPSHQFSLDMARAVVTSAEPLAPLLIYGGPGVGKTRLLQTAGEEFTASNPEARVRYSTAIAYVDELLEHLGEAGIAEFTQTWTGIDLLLLDQIEDISRRDKTQEVLLDRIERLYSTGTRVILACSLSMAIQGEFKERFHKRFPMSVAAGMSIPGWDMSEQVLSSEGEPALPPEVAQTIVALCGPSDIRRLKGAVMRLRAWCSQKGLPLSPESAIRALTAVYL